MPALTALPTTSISVADHAAETSICPKTEIIENNYSDDLFTPDVAIGLIKKLGNPKLNDSITPSGISGFVSGTNRKLIYSDVKKLLHTLKTINVYYNNGDVNKYKAELVSFKKIQEKKPKYDSKYLQKRIIPCFVCPTMFATKDGRNKHMRSHFRKRDPLGSNYLVLGTGHLERPKRFEPF